MARSMQVGRPRGHSGATTRLASSLGPVEVVDEAGDDAGLETADARVTAQATKRPLGSSGARIDSFSSGTLTSSSNNNSVRSTSQLIQ